MNKIELLSPAGNLEKLRTALYFGANAVYLGGKNFGLRANADNFDLKELQQALALCKKYNAKLYVTVNIFAHNKDISPIIEYLKFLESIKVDGIIASDMGVIHNIKKFTSIPLHVSTQANVTNKESAKFFHSIGATRIVLARELSIEEIKEIKDAVPELEIEAFVHGAMCMAYSGRCLLSNYLTGRESNSGACAQSCRWEYYLVEKKRDEFIKIEEDERGSYLLNSKDLNMIEHLDKLKSAGVSSFKIEGRSKSPYYVASTTWAYRQAVDYLQECDSLNKSYECKKEWSCELLKVGNRMYTTGFYFGKDLSMQSYKTSAPMCDYDFMAIVLEKHKDYVVIEQRNRFKVFETLEILSPTLYNKKILVEKMQDLEGNTILDAYLVMQKIKLYTDLPLNSGDILRKQKIFNT